MEEIKQDSKKVVLAERKEDIEMNTETKGNRVSRNLVSVEDLLKTENSRATERISSRMPCDEVLPRDIFSTRIGNDRLIDFDIPVRIREPRPSERIKDRNAHVIERKHRLAKSKNALVSGRQIISGLSKHGIEAKPFCIHVQKAKEKNFIVQGKDFKWFVVSLKSYEEILNIPKQEWNTLVKLEKAGVKHGGVYIAAPLKGTAAKVARAEVKEMCKNAVMKAGAILILPFNVAATIADVMTKDPVLLLRFSGFREGDLYLDLGRWE